MKNAILVFYRRSVPLKNMVVLLVLLAVSATETFVMAQQTTSETKKGTSLLLQFFGPEALGIHINHNVSQRVSLNTGLGADLGVHLGANAYLTDRTLKRFAWYGGAQLYLIREFQFTTGDIFGSIGTTTSNKRETQVGLYLPVGFEYMAKKGFTIQLDIGPNFVKEDWGQTNTADIMGSLKIGYTFRAKQ